MGDMQMTNDTITSRSRDPWRFCCPRWHHALKYRPTNPPDSTYICRTCQANGHAHEYSFDDLVDKKAHAQADDGEWIGP